jgi:Skp family chaperone for outer membrane proteins
MTQEIVSGAETELTAPVVENTEVTTPEPTADGGPEPGSEDAKAEKSPEQRELERLRRQLTKRDRTQGKLHQELQQARERLSQLETTEPTDKPRESVDPHALAREIALVEKVTEKSNQIAKEGTKRFPDFMETIAAISEELGPLFDQRGRPAPVMEAVFDAEKPADLLHFLGKNPDLAAELEGLTPAQLGRRIARLETQMAEQAKPKTSAAPKPLEPVRGGASDNELRSDLSTEEWMRRREAQLRRN